MLSCQKMHKKKEKKQQLLPNISWWPELKKVWVATKLLTRNNHNTGMNGTDQLQAQQRVVYFILLYCKWRVYYSPKIFMLIFILMSLENSVNHEKKNSLSQSFILFIITPHTIFWSTSTLARIGLKRLPDLQGKQLDFFFFLQESVLI